jgi:hypothetical protein
MSIRSTVILIAAVVLVAVLWYRDRLFPPPETPPTTTAAQTNVPGLTEKGLKILQFYAASGTVSPGDEVLVCYGVVNAVKATITPDVGPVRPLYNKCLRVAPKQTTTYTLTASDAAGHSTSESFRIVVAAPQIQDESEKLPAGEPVIRRFEIDSSRPVGPDGVASLCYRVDGASEVEVAPDTLPRTSAPEGCFYVAPKGTQTYTLTAYGAGGKTAVRSLTVTAPAP